MRLGGIVVVCVVVSPGGDQLVLFLFLYYIFFRMCLYQLNDHGVEYLVESCEILNLII